MPLPQVKKLHFLLFPLLLNCQIPHSQNHNWEVCFSPQGNCTQLRIKTIESAEHEIYVQAYSFTSQPIGEALIRMHKAGKQVSVIVDKTNLTDKSYVDELVAGGVNVWVDHKHPRNHNKTIIVDNKRVYTGSTNFSKGSENNAENGILIEDSELAAEYMEDWRKHVVHSKKIN